MDKTLKAALESIIVGVVTIALAFLFIPVSIFCAIIPFLCRSGARES